MNDNIILVDRDGVQIGVGEKLYVHRTGLLHRAFSVFVFRSGSDDVEVLLQKRAIDKYHSGGLWSNTCCSHPCPGETVLAAAHRRLHEEMGFDCPLQETFSFIYEAQFPNGLVEHEYDHVLCGTYSGDVVINPDEIDAYRWVAWDFLCKDVEQDPEQYTWWLREILTILKREKKMKHFIR